VKEKGYYGQPVFLAEMNQLPDPISNAVEVISLTFNYDPNVAIPDSPYVNVSENLFCETLLYMRILLKQEKLMINSVKVIKALVDNIIKEPTNEKYHRVRFENPKIKEAIADID
jgi:hypothetical protein